MEGPQHQNYLELCLDVSSNGISCENLHSATEPCESPKRLCRVLGLPGPSLTMAPEATPANVCA